MSVYNGSSTLQEALDSVYAQTFQDFEIVICDDGSSDDTYSILEANAKEHPEMVLLRNDANIKVAAALNRCIDVARGEYLARMDADDISAPGRFARQVAFLDEHPDYDVVSSSFTRFDSHGEWMKCLANKNEPDEKALIFGVPFLHASCMIRKTALAEIGNYTTDAKVERAEDVYLWYKFFKAGKRGYVLPEILYNMRDDRNAARRRRVSDRIRFARLKYEILGGLGLKRWRVVALYEASKALVPPVLVYKIKKLFSKSKE